MVTQDTDTSAQAIYSGYASNDQAIKDNAFPLRFLLMGYIIFSVGIIMLLACQLLLPQGVLRSVITNLAVALIPAGTIMVAYEYYMRKEFLQRISQSISRALAESELTKRVTELDKLISFTNDLRPFGLQRVHRTRRDIDIEDLMNAARPGTEIKMLGTALVCVNQYDMQRVLVEKLEAGCTVKLLSINPDSPFVKQRAEEEHRDLSEIQGVIRRTCENNDVFITTVNEKLRPRIRCMHYDAPPMCFMVCNGDTMVVSFYLREQRGEDVPHFQIEIKEGGIYKPFMDHFDALFRELKASADIPADCEEYVSDRKADAHSKSNDAVNK